MNVVHTTNKPQPVTQINSTFKVSSSNIWNTSRHCASLYRKVKSMVEWMSYKAAYSDDDVQIKLQSGGGSKLM